MSKPKLKEIIKLFEKGTNFSLDRQQYIALTGIDIPQDKNYTAKKSAVAKKAKEYGYSITVIPEKLSFRINKESKEN